MPVDQVHHLLRKWQYTYSIVPRVGFVCWQFFKHFFDGQLMDLPPFFRQLWYCTLFKEVTVQYMDWQIGNNHESNHISVFPITSCTVQYFPTREHDCLHRSTGSWKLFLFSTTAPIPLHFPFSYSIFCRSAPLFQHISKRVLRKEKGGPTWSIVGGEGGVGNQSCVWG